MPRILINGKPVHTRDGATILEASYEDVQASRQFDIKIPFLHYLKGVKQEDSSGLSVVEIEGQPGLYDASAVIVTEGMKIQTKTPAVIEKQKRSLKEILDHHDLDCRNCPRTGNCELQQLQWVFRMTKIPSEAKRKNEEIDASGIIVRDHNKCVRCGRCVEVCTNIQQIGAIEMQGNGMTAHIVPKGAEKLSNTKCVNCGQCIAVCPVGALYERDDVAEIKKAIQDPEKFVVIQAAPSVRASVGEYFGYPVGAKVEGKLAAALRMLGFDRVFDTTFGADLTIMEEATELVGRIKNGGVLPMTTSCCPGWVKFCEQEFPELLPHMSSCKSPQQMFGAIVKSYFAQKEGIAKENIVVVSAMPCTAKKFELTRPDEDGAGVPDVDYSLTARELCRMMEQEEIPFMSLADEEFDSPLGTGTGAGVIFGATGGVMEAALRTAADWLSGESIPNLEYTAVRGISGMKEAEVEIAGQKLKVAAVSGLKNARALMERVAAKETEYVFIEVMACPGGCVNGGGQPQQQSVVRMTNDLRSERAKTLYALDDADELRKAHENPEVQTVYADYLGEQGSELAHQLLHTTYINRGNQ